MPERIHFYQTIVFIDNFQANTQAQGSIVTPMENCMGNLDPIRLFHNRWTSPLPIVGTDHAIKPGGFGNPGLDREIGSGNGTERYRTHQVFDVTNPKKVGGSTTGHATHPPLWRRSGGHAPPFTQIRGFCLENVERYVAADLDLKPNTTVAGRENSFCRRVRLRAQIQETREANATSNRDDL